MSESSTIPGVATEEEVVAWSTAHGAAHDATRGPRVVQAATALTRRHVEASKTWCNDRWHGAALGESVCIRFRQDAPVGGASG
jgi:hypothetical protein